MWLAPSLGDDTGTCKAVDSNEFGSCSRGMFAMGRTDVDLTEDLKEMVELACRGGTVVGGAAAAATIAGGSGTVASLIAGTAATGGIIIPALVAGALLGVLVGKLACPTLSQNFVETARAKIGGRQALLTPERQLLRHELERQIGFGVTDTELDHALIHVGDVLRANHPPGRRA